MIIGQQTTSSVGTTVYKNTLLGRALIGKLGEEAQYKAPKGLISIKPMTRAVYSPFGENAEDVQISLAGDENRYIYASLKELLDFKSAEEDRLKAEQERLESLRQEQEILKQKEAEAKARAAEEERVRLEEERIKREQDLQKKNFVVLFKILSLMKKISSSKELFFIKMQCSVHNIFLILIRKMLSDRIFMMVTLF